MAIYKTRTIQFRELIEINHWKIKIYTISKHGEFNHPIFYQQVMEQLPEWLKSKNSFNSTHDHIAFLILHSGTEGIFSLINWWIGRNMLNTNIYLTSPTKPAEFTKISGDGFGPCIWELEIINHERVSWTENILKKSESPNYTKYLKDVINTEI